MLLNVMPVAKANNQNDAPSKQNTIRKKQNDASVGFYEMVQLQSNKQKERQQPTHSPAKKPSKHVEAAPYIVKRRPTIHQIDEYSFNLLTTI